jgi:hypothetical protein
MSITTRMAKRKGTRTVYTFKEIASRTPATWIFGSWCGRMDGGENDDFEKKGIFLVNVRAVFGSADFITQFRIARLHLAYIIVFGTVGGRSYTNTNTPFSPLTHMSQCRIS